jgi:dTDP-4-dehydrorhamnose reductase
MTSHHPIAKKQESLHDIRLELWGGLECTVARIGNMYRDQIKETQHFERPSDLERIASLGIRTLRYPIIWETISPEHPDRTDWRWHDDRLEKLRKLDISPIAGLIHHGSGPHYTNLLDPSFPDMLARHAGRVAKRYPWIKLFTPVNEPLTTARFSGLYGHWYPHAQRTDVFLKALIHQCRAVVLSMQAIRKITPDAKLIQTEDLGKTFSTPLLQYQADYENERRWLSFDLLCGRVDRSHAWYARLMDAGIEESQLIFFLEHPCPPDVIGINHYLTSERYLDHNPGHYPDYHLGGNGRHHYADAEAVRVELPQDEIGAYARICEAWERYQLPIAVTEAHHGCSRDEQVRWLIEVWNAARKLKSEGADIRAVTIWSLFGAVDWNSLLTQQNGSYEPGAFDVRGKLPRATALAAAAASLAGTGEFDHPVLDRLGWWRRDERFYRPPHKSAVVQLAHSPRRLLVNGATGTLGQAFSRICHSRGLDHDLLSRKDMDITDSVSVENALLRYRPWAVINTAGFVRVAEAAENAERCHKENAVGAEVLAKVCARLSIPYVTFSSDLVFDGRMGRAYVESDDVCPVCVYGFSKADAEKRVLSVWERALVIRTSAFFGPWDQYNFLHSVLRSLSAGQEIMASSSTLVSPTYVPDLVHATLDLLIDGETGIWHLTNQGSISWHDFALRTAQAADIDAGLLVKTGNERHLVTSLSSERGILLPSLDSAIERFLRENTISWKARDQRSVAAG